MKEAGQMIGTSYLAAQLDGLSDCKRQLLASLLNREGLDSTILQKALQPERGKLQTLSRSQKRLWRLSRLGQPSPCHNATWAAYLSGSLDQRGLPASLNRLIARRDLLHSVFPLRQGDPVQVVVPAKPLPLPLVDLTGLPASQRQREWERVASRASQIRFDLSKAPLLRALLVRWGEQEHTLLLSWHRLLVGECGERLLFQELSQLQESWQGTAAEPAAGLQAGQCGSLEAWKGKIEKDLPRLELPTDRPRPPLQSLRARRASLGLQRRVAAKLEAGSGQGSLRAALAAAFQALLSLCSGQKSLVVALWDEQDPGLSLLASELSPDQPFSDLSSQIGSQLEPSLAQARVSPDRLAEELGLNEDCSRALLAEALFCWRNPGCHSWRCPSGLEWRLEDKGPAALRRDVVFQAELDEQGLTGELLCNADLFEQATVDWMAALLGSLLKAAARNPGLPLSRLPLLSKRQRRQILEEWDFTPMPGWKPQCIHQMVEEQAGRRPDAISVSFQGRQLSYGGLIGLAQQIAQRLGGGQRRERAAILLENGPEVIGAMLGTLMAGHAFATLDPSYPSARLGHILQEVEPAWLITLGDSVRSVQPLIDEYLGEQDCRVIQLDEGLNQPRPAYQPATAVRPEDPVYVAFTSGSTGRPKGILHTHRSFGAFLHWYTGCFELEEGKRVGQWTSITFDPSFCEIFGALCRGAAICPAPSPIQADPEAVIDWLRDQAVTLLEIVPSFGRQILQALKSGKPPGGKSPLPSLQQLSFVGEALPTGLVREYQVLFGERLRMANLYGPTEAVVATFHFIEIEDGQRRSVPVGRPIKGCQVLILDSRGELCPVGIKGELYIRSQSLAEGYFRRPQQTHRSFLKNPFHDGPPERFYRTGDLGRWLPHGEIEFFGRRDHQVKIRGVRVELEEVEAALSRHPAVRECALAAHEYAPGDKRLIGYVVRRTDWQWEQSESGESGLSGLQSYHLSQCQKLYDGLYRLSPSYSQLDQGLNLRVWTSGTNQSYGEDEVLEVIEDTVQQILSRRPRRILEIGSGAGLLLFRLAPHCDLYQATDISSSALDHLRQRLEGHPQPLPSVRIEKRAAHQLQEVASNSFDAVVLSFVSMHFPDIGYMVRFLEQAARITAPGGFVFLGGVRHLQLLKVFQTALQLSQAAADQPLAQLRKRIRRRLETEKDLAVDPAFFEAFAEHSTHFSQAVIQPIASRCRNDITRYLYDATLHVGHRVSQTRSIRWTDWSASGMTLESLPQLLDDLEAGPVGLSAIENARLINHLQACQMVHQSPSPWHTAGEVRQALQDVQAGSAADPADVRRLADEMGCSVRMNWSRSGEQGRFDAVFECRNGNELDELEILPRPAPARPLQATRWAIYANNPLQAISASRLAPQLRDYLKERLPEQFVPARFVFLKALPRSPNGKVDRKKLPQPDRSRPEFGEGWVPPSTPLQIRVCEIWRDVLHIEQLGIDDDFFELGGHSLLATQVVGQIREAFSIEFPLQSFFQSPTIAGLSESIEAEMGRGNAEEEGRLAKLVRQVASLSEGEAQALAQHGFEALPEGRETP